MNHITDLPQRHPDIKVSGSATYLLRHITADMIEAFAPWDEPEWDGRGAAIWFNTAGMVRHG